MSEIEKLIGGALLLLAVGFVGYAYSSRDDDDDAASATVAIHEFVKDRLKAPSSADFPWSDVGKTERISSGEFKLSSYVDAENSFGASLRTHYSVTVKKQGDRWVLRHINIR